eukprot:gene19719-30390_t
MIFDLTRRVSRPSSSGQHARAKVPGVHVSVAATASVFFSSFTLQPLVSDSSPLPSGYSILRDVHPEVLVCACVSFASKVEYTLLPSGQLVNVWRRLLLEFDAGALPPGPSRNPETAARGDPAAGESHGGEAPRGTAERTLVSPPRKSPGDPFVDGKEAALPESAGMLRYVREFCDSGTVAIVEYYLVEKNALTLHVVHPFAAAEVLLRRLRQHDSGGNDERSERRLAGTKRLLEGAPDFGQSEKRLKGSGAHDTGPRTAETKMPGGCSDQQRRALRHDTDKIFCLLEAMASEELLFLQLSDLPLYVPPSLLAFAALERAGASVGFKVDPVTLLREVESLQDVATVRADIEQFYELLSAAGASPPHVLARRVRQMICDAAPDPLRAK